MGTKAQRRAARDRVGTYHEARLAELVEHIAGDLDRYRTGEIDAYTLDETIHHYHRAARELWKFCFSGGGGTHSEITAHLLEKMNTDGDTMTGGTGPPRDNAGDLGVPPPAGVGRKRSCPVSGGPVAGLTNQGGPMTC